MIGFLLNAIFTCWAEENYWEELKDYYLSEGYNQTCNPYTYQAINGGNQSLLKFSLNPKKGFHRIVYTFTLYSQNIQSMYFIENSYLLSHCGEETLQIISSPFLYCNSQKFTQSFYFRVQSSFSMNQNYIDFEIRSDMSNKFIIKKCQIYCAKCSSSSTCSECMPTFELDNTNFCACPYEKSFIYQNLCHIQCPLGYFGVNNKCQPYTSIQNLIFDNSATQFILINDYNTSYRVAQFNYNFTIFAGPFIQNEAIIYKLVSPIVELTNVLIDFEIMFLDSVKVQLFSLYFDEYLVQEFVTLNDLDILNKALYNILPCVFLGHSRCFKVRLTYLIKQVEQLSTIKLKGNLPINNQNSKWSVSFMKVDQIEIPPQPTCLKKKFFSECLDTCPLTTKTIGDVCESITYESEFSHVLKIDYDSEFTKREYFFSQTSNVNPYFLQFYNERYIFGGYRLWQNQQFSQAIFFITPHYKLKVSVKILLIDPLDNQDVMIVIFGDKKIIIQKNHPNAQCINQNGVDGCLEQEIIGTEAEDFLILFEEEIDHDDSSVTIDFKCESKSSQLYCAYFDLIILSAVCPFDCSKCSSSSDCVEYFTSTNMRTYDESIYYKCPSQGYFWNKGCQKCFPFCLECDDNNECKVCKENYIMVSGQCICKFNNVSANRTDCKNECDDSCSVCQNSYKSSRYQFQDIKHCAECKIEEFKVLNVNVCICIDGYYMNQQTSPYTCLQCNEKCKTCYNVLNCFTCYLDQNRELNNNNYCQCIQGFYEINSSICQQCSSKCKTCLNEVDFCTSCYTEKFRTLSNNNTCGCQQGFYENVDQICKRCNSQCETCLNQSICLTCDENLFRILQKQLCLCLEGYYEDDYQKCKRCYYSCSRCNNNNIQNQCTQCPQTRQKYQQNALLFDCICKSGYYDIGDLQCLPCSQFENPSIEHVCYSKCGDKIIQWNEECDDGNSEPRDDCYQCLVPNSSCLDQNCSQCQFKQCVQCNTGYYLTQNLKCLKCSDDCLTCEYSENHCLQCKYKSKITNTCINCNQENGFQELDAQCFPICGDGIKVELEECDDNNTLNDDGCNQFCQIEQGFECQNTCTKIQYLDIILKENQADSIYNSERKIFLYFNQIVTINNEQEISKFININPISSNLEFDVLNIQKFDTSSIEISLKLKSSQIDPQISIIINSTIIKESQNFLIRGNFLGFITLKDYYEQSQFSLEATQNAISLSTAVLYFMLIFIIIAFVFGGLEIFWNFLDTVQLISYLEYFNVIYPYNLEQYFKLFNFAQFDFIKNNFNISSFLTQYVEHSKVPLKFSNEGYTSIFLINIVPVIIVLLTTTISILLTKLILYLLMRQTKKFKKYRIHNSNKQLHYTIYVIFTIMQNIENTLLKLSFYFKNALLRSFMCSSFELNLAILLQLQNIELSNSFLFLNFCSTLAIIIVQILVFNYGTYIINKVEFNSKVEIKYLKLEAYFEGVKIKSNNFSAYYNIFNQLKKILFIVFLVSFYNFPYYQIGLISALSLINSLFLFKIKPLSDLNELTKQLVSEITLWIIQILTLILASFNEIKKWWQFSLSEYFGWSIIILLNFILLFQLFYDVKQHIHYLATKYQCIRNIKLQIWQIAFFRNFKKNQTTEYKTGLRTEKNRFTTQMSFISDAIKNRLEKRVLISFKIQKIV